MKQYIEQAKSVYSTHIWARLAAFAGIVMTGGLLLWLSGGFPPLAWRFLFRVIPTLPQLWAREGVVFLLPLTGLLLLSATLFIAWTALLTIFIRLLEHWWLERQELRRFAKEVEQVEERVAVQFAQQAHASPIASVTGSRSSAEINVARSEGEVEITRREVGSPTRRGALTRVPTDDAGSRSHQEYSPAARYAQGAVSVASPPVSMIQFTVGTGIHTGILRKDKPNEDSLLSVQCTRLTQDGPQPAGLFAVADGMGGHHNGREASQLALRVLSETITPGILHEAEDSAFPELLSKGVNAANLAVYERNQQEHSNMGTTLTIALLIGTTAYIANVGDSRTYLYRAPEGLSQITRDHSVVANLVAAGKISPDAVYTHPQRNVIYLSLGDSPAIDCDQFTVTLEEGDLLLLCSDGLWEMVRDSEIKQIIVSVPVFAHPSYISDRLIQAALDHGGVDNVSAVVVRVNS